MTNLNSMSKFKAIAIGCAVILTCATAQLFSSVNYATVDAATVSYTYEVNADGCGVVHLDSTNSTSVTLSLSGGKSGYTTSGEVGYWDNDASKWVSQYYTWANQKFDTSGNLTISGIKIPSGVSDVQILITYYADWSSGSEVLGNMSDIKVSSVNTGSSSGSTTTSSGNTTTKPSTSENSQSNWKDITEGTTNNQSKNLVSEKSSSGSKTVTITQGGQWSSYDEGNEAIVLDQTFTPEKDADGNDVYYTDSGNEAITNSNNFMFTDDFGVPTGAEINHFRFTFESDTPMYNAQFGAGISVKKGSEIANSGATEKSQMIWFNESGTIGGEEYANIVNDNGKYYCGLNATYEGGTQYIQAQWDIYDDVKPYVQNDAWSSVSAQYWYGVNPADYETAEGGEVELQPKEVKITEATCNYNVTQTYDYTDTAKKTLSDTLSIGSGDMYSVSLADLGLTNQDKPKSVTFTLSGDSDIGKLVGAFGVSVNDEYKGEDATNNWYQSPNLVYEDCGKTYQVTWLIPEDISDYVDAEYDAEVKFGCWYAGAGENALSSLNITNVAVDYYTEAEQTTATTTVTTPSITTQSGTTTTTPSITDGIKGDEIDLGMGPIDPADDDETSPTFHQFEIPIMDLLPTTYDPKTNDIAQIVFNISSPADMEKVVGACGIAVGLDCPDATAEYWFQDEDFEINQSGKNITITWTVPESIREYVQENSYGKVSLGIWYTGTDEVYLDSAYVVYTSTESQTTTTPIVTTTPNTTTTTTTSGTDDIIWGDVNCDGNVKSNDLLLLKKYLLGLSDITPQGLLNADITHDGNVKSNDLLLLKKYLLGLVDSLA